MHEYELLTPIGPDVAMDFREFLSQRDERAEFVIKINSPGGHVFSADDMIDAIRTHRRQHNSRFTAIVVGLAASAAVSVALATDEIVAQPQALVMVHRSHVQPPRGGRDVMRSAADMLQKIDDRIAKMVAQKTKLSIDAVNELMSRDRWLDAQEAKRIRLVDRIADEAITPVPASVGAMLDDPTYRAITAQLEL